MLSDDQLRDMLPYLARITGGDAGIFDAGGGIRFFASENSPVIYSQPGRTLGRTDKAREALSTQSPSMSSDPENPAMMTVYYPLDGEHGLFFCNDNAIRRSSLSSFGGSVPLAKYTMDDIVGSGARMSYAKSLCPIGAKASSVLLTGETGTGKELFAQAIHNCSARRDKPFIAINCGAIPASIIESYLFGYAAGSFTGAKKGGNPGVFEQANHGTILLDEISEMPFELQVRLLRVLQEKEVTRVGEVRPIQLDIKVIATTNRNLPDEVAAGRFREDLYYRINSLEIHIPALREHKEDIPSLVGHFIRGFDLQQGKNIREVHPDYLAHLMEYDWPGNIRELKGCIERSVNMADDCTHTLCTEHLPLFLIDRPETLPFVPETDNLKEQALYAEAACILRAIRACGGSKKEAAARLGITKATLWRKLKDYEALTSVRLPADEDEEAEKR